MDDVPGVTESGDAKAKRLPVKLLAVGDPARELSFPTWLIEQARKHAWRKAEQEDEG